MAEARIWAASAVELATFVLGLMWLGAGAKLAELVRGKGQGGTGA